MSFLCDNLAAICVAAVASTLAWLFGGTRDLLIISVAPWLLLLLFEVVVCFPQQHRGETSVDARIRVWKSLKKDWMVWVVAGFLILLAIPFVNTGYCRSCDYFRIVQENLDPDPPVPFLPYCVNRTQHLAVFLWFATALGCLVATKHALCRRGKRLVLELIVWNGFALALLGFVQAVFDAPGPLWQPLEIVWGRKTKDFFSVWGYPNMAGSYFVTLFGLAVALWRDHYDRARIEAERATDSRKKHPKNMFWKRNLCLVPAVLFFFAALNTLSRAAIAFVTVLAVLFFIHTFLSFAARVKKVKRVKGGAVAILVLGIICLAATLFMPKDLQREVVSINSFSVADRLTGKGQYHGRVASGIWRENFLFGCGGWGYRHFCVDKMSDEEVKGLQYKGGSNVHNDYLQFLAEHGTVGVLALLAILVLLLMPMAFAWRTMARSVRFAKSRLHLAKPLQIFVLPAPVFFILLTALTTFIHAFGDCPFRSPAILSLFFIELAALYGFMPKVEEE